MKLLRVSGRRCTLCSAFSKKARKNVEIFWALFLKVQRKNVEIFWALFLKVQRKNITIFLKKSISKTFLL
jgi:hypothetical protein